MHQLLLLLTIPIILIVSTASFAKDASCGEAVIYDGALSSNTAFTSVYYSSSCLGNFCNPHIAALTRQVEMTHKRTTCASENSKMGSR
jgi:hypothetical protein